MTSHKHKYMRCKTCGSIQEFGYESGNCLKCGTHLTDGDQTKNSAKKAPILGFGYNNSPWAEAFRRDLIDIRVSDFADVEAKLAKGQPKNGKQKSQVPVQSQVPI